MNLYKYHTNPEKLDLHDKAQENVPALVWKKYKWLPSELKKREKILAKDPVVAADYAIEVLKGKFPAGEAQIAKDPESAFQYAVYALYTRFPAGEKAILKDSDLAISYAKRILNMSHNEAVNWAQKSK